MSGHGKSLCLFVTIPLQLDSNKLLGLCICFELTAFLHCLDQVLQVLIVVVLHQEIINNKCKIDVTGLMLEATFQQASLVVASFSKSSCKIIMCCFPSLFQPAPCFVHPCMSTSVACFAEEVASLCDSCWMRSDQSLTHSASGGLDPKVHVGDVTCGSAGPISGNNFAELALHGLHRGAVSGGITTAIQFVSTAGHSWAPWLVFLRAMVHCMSGVRCLFPIGNFHLMHEGNDIHAVGSSQPCADQANSLIPACIHLCLVTGLGRRVCLR